MTPLSLHATAAAWSLHAARARLTYLASTQPRHDDGPLAVAAVLRSPTYGVRYAPGGHGDPVTALLTADSRHADGAGWAELVERLEGRVSGIARMFGLDGADPLAAILAAIPTMTATNAHWLTRHLRDEDKWVRDACRLDEARHPMPPGTRCPACRGRNLHIQNAGPREVWTVVCDGSREPGQPHNPCLCVGVGCPCGVEGAVQGVAHIWRLGAVAGATPTHTTT